MDSILQKMIENKEDIEIKKVEDLDKNDLVRIFILDGGIGDIICSTPMIERARKEFPNKKIIVRTFYPDVYFHNPNVDVLYSANSINDMFEKWVKPLKDYKSILKRDLYNFPTYSMFPGKVSEIWCKLYDIPYDGDNTKLYLTKEEEEESIQFLKSFDREVILIQPFSSRFIGNPGQPLTENKDWFAESWQEVVKELQFSYDIVQVGGKNEETIKGVSFNVSGTTNFRQTMALVKNSLTFVTLDSFINHVGPAVGKPGVVLFGRSNPLTFGHDMNSNIWIKESCQDIGCGRPQSYFGDNELYKGQVRAWKCQDRKCMKSITPRIVIDKVYDLIRTIKEQTSKKL